MIGYLAPEVVACALAWQGDLPDPVRAALEEQLDATIGRIEADLMIARAAESSTLRRYLIADYGWEFQFRLPADRAPGANRTLLICDSREESAWARFRAGHADAEQVTCTRKAARR